jgi:DAK2 domain fusion protein YloV
VFRVYLRVLLDHREIINRLNVYPVPDEDTGTNLSLTVQSVVDHLRDTNGLEQVCDAIARGSLMGARGASGLILSQLLRTLANHLKDAGGVDGTTVSEGFVAAAADATGAVLTPVEGTILTVAREAAGAAVVAARQGADLAGVLLAARASAADTLAHTPEMLPALAKAGVVDAGGTGLVLLLDAFLNVVAGVPLPSPEGTLPTRGRDVEPQEERFELVVLLDAREENLDLLRRTWQQLGNESTVVVGGEGTWVCHLHTNELERAVVAARAAGLMRSIRVTDLVEQVELLRQAVERPSVTTGLVAVVSGPGLEERFRTRGAVLVRGGRSLDPSTELLLTAVETAGTPGVVLLPNDKNIVPVAEQVPAFAEATVVVVPSRSLPQGLAALDAYDPDDPPEVNQRRMSQVAAATRSGEVTRASRNASSERGAIRAGDWLGFVDGRMTVIATSIEDALGSVLTGLAGFEPAGLLIVEGEGAEPSKTERAVADLVAAVPGLEVEVFNGGQPHYPYLIGTRSARSTPA